ncbi:uncharacterized protein LOC116290448 [Actinia tenebrosa]|uniref:Uncharacterized protein LOC116290448 n=1 Tax=Actinia tenebrosa TaxID=6105 RepID=A0A6P8HKW6_ACTTE|nr:uncharacterized protein LOC116290448 [Actinia tenebrosa]
MYYAEDPLTPYLLKGKYTWSFEQKLHILVLDVNHDKVCIKRPNNVQENSLFVMNRSKLKNEADWLMTDLGAFDNRGSNAWSFVVQGNTVVESQFVRNWKTLEMTKGQYILKNVFYRHKKYKDFLRTSTVVLDHNGKELPLALLEYRYTGNEHHVSPHKNPRTGKSFVQTAPSTKAKIKEKVKGHQGPSSIFDQTVEEDSRLEKIRYVGGDRDKAQQGFISPLKGCTFLPCKKHVVDDITRKVNELGLNKACNEILKDIFGCERNKEKGIVDTTSDDEFLAKAMSVTDKWDGMEIEKKKTDSPEFSHYFRTYIQEDLKNGMLLGARRKAGLGDEFFYNNAQECSNFKYKSKIRESKFENATGYRPSMKCTWVEAIKIYGSMVEEVNREKERALLRKGQFLLSPNYRHLEITIQQWSSMTPNERQQRLAKLSLKSCATPFTVESKEKHATPLGKFEDTSLPEFLRGSFMNASKIVELKGVGPFPNNTNKRTVISLSKSTVHTVDIQKSGKVVCNDTCPRYKEHAICAHTIAVARCVGKLLHFLDSYKAPLDRMVRSSISSGSGMKANQKKRKRVRGADKILWRYIPDKIQPQVFNILIKNLVFHLQCNIVSCFSDIEDFDFNLAVISSNIRVPRLNIR